MANGLQTVSYTQIKTWCECRMKWYWAYDLGIQKRRVAAPISIGSCGHRAIEALLRGEDWIKAIDEWVAKETDPGTHKLYDEQVEEFHQMGELIKGVMGHYCQTYDDCWETITVEQEFIVSIRGMKMKMRGFWDAIVQDRDGDLWLLEHKFPQQQFRTEEMTDLDAQIGIYQWAAIRNGFPIVGTIYNQLLAQVPKIPEMNESKPTMSKRDIKTTWAIYARALVENGLDPADYLDMKEKLDKKEFFRRYFIRRELPEIRNFMADVEKRVWDMTRAKKHIYMCESQINCSRCSFRELCIETVKGGDVDFLLEHEFEPRDSKNDLKEVPFDEPTAE